MYKLYQDYCKELQRLNHHRALLMQASRDILPPFLDFSTNDYLGLSHDKEVHTAAYQAAHLYGIGATGSRLLSGNNALYEIFEEQIALDKKTAAALVFNSGFQANSTVLASLLQASVLKGKPLVFFDRFNHSSLYQGVFLSGAELIRYRHNDMNHLADLLKKFSSQKRPLFIVTETIFGMDGDHAPLQDILELASTYQAFLYLDEAHATGIMGEKGYGLSTTVCLESIPHLIMGTFSKALGCSGAYIATATPVTEYLINKAPGFIYSTAPSPMVMGGAFKAWQKIGSMDKERESLIAIADYLRKQLQQLGFDTGTSEYSPIVPIILKTEQNVLTVQKYLLKKHILVSAIRPPTVPANSARLRLAVHVQHRPEDIDYVLKTLKEM